MAYVVIPESVELDGEVWPLAVAYTSGPDAKACCYIMVPEPWMPPHREPILQVVERGLSCGDHYTPKLD